MNNNTTKRVTAVVINTLPEIKTKSNGKKYQTLMVKFIDKDHALYGMKYWAQRTITGDPKLLIIGDIVECVYNIVDGKPFFEAFITSDIDSANGIMKKRVLLLAVSCKKGGLCPGGLDLDNPNNWIRIVKDDGQAGAIQGFEIDFAKPLDVIEFKGRPMPQGKQKENWVIDNNSCRKIETKPKSILEWAYQQYSYHGFWGNFKPYLNEEEFEKVTAPSESIMRVSNVRIYLNERDKAKIDFDWEQSKFRMQWISMTDQDFYGRIKEGDVTFDEAYIITSIPKEIDDYVNPYTGQKQAFKFISKIFEISLNDDDYFF